ncbi:hypothetical protein PS843_04560 [Pseudomonas fluorescens]|nr:hypothetical protein PS843_04560 [Pseudomonas fluorescens]
MRNLYGIRGINYILSLPLLERLFFVFDKPALKYVARARCWLISMTLLMSGRDFGRRKSN